MKISDVIKLLDAGFTRDEIAKFEEQPEKQNQQPDQAQQQTQQQDQAPDQMQETLKQVKDTLAAIQKANLQTAAQAGAAIQTSDDVWKSFFGKPNNGKE